jgi:nitroreductase
MSIIQSIEQRRSVRSYTGEPLKKEHADSITNYIASLTAPFGINARINLIHTHTGGERIKLGTYGYIGGASDYLTLVYEEAPLAEEGAAYLFEQVILFCTGLGLGTCWLGGSFSRKDFAGQLSLKPEERLRIVSPVGYPDNKKRLVETLINAPGKHKSRKPFENLFFYKNFATPLSETLAGVYRKPLEMVRIAPSANNSQPWRIVFDERALHFYHRSAFGGFSAIDMGIALCHFQQTCIELNIDGRFERISNPNDVPAVEGCRYSVSWTI